MTYNSTVEFMVSIRDIAKKVGISRSAVSLALRNKPGVSEATRAEVLRAAEELGYQPNPEMSRMLSQVRQNEIPTYRSTLGWINMVSRDSNWFEYSFWQQVLAGAQNMAERLGYKFEQFWTKDPGLTEKRLSQILEARGIRGLCLGPTNDPASIPDFNWSVFSAIFIGHAPNDLPIARVCSNHQQSISHALETVNQRGYSRVGLLLVKNMENLTSHLWESGLYLFQHLHQDSAETFLKIVEPDQFWGSEIKEWISDHQLDAILSPHIDLLRYLKQEGFRVPGDLGFVCLDWDRSQAGVTGMNQRADRIGLVAMQVLHGLLDSQSSGESSHSLITLVDAHWNEGDTVTKASMPPYSS
ncbi:MAG: LacI family DNA-binding transcriptional regulator [Verrucomicrobiota bacterium]